MQKDIRLFLSFTVLVGFVALVYYGLIVNPYGPIFWSQVNPFFQSMLPVSVLAAAVAGFTRCLVVSTNGLLGIKQIVLHSLSGAFLGVIGGLVIWLVLFETLIPSKQSTSALILIACATGWIINNHKPGFTGFNKPT